MLTPDSWRKDFMEGAKARGLNDLESMLMTPEEKMMRKLKPSPPGSWVDEGLSSLDVPAVSQQKREPWIDKIRRKKRLW